MRKLVRRLTNHGATTEPIWLIFGTRAGNIVPEEDIRYFLFPNPTLNWRAGGGGIFGSKLELI